MLSDCQIRLFHIPAWGGMDGFRLSISLAGIIHTKLDAINFGSYGLADIILAVGVYRVLYYLFDRFIWRLRLLRKLGLVTVPNLNER